MKSMTVSLAMSFSLIALGCSATTEPIQVTGAPTGSTAATFVYPCSAQDREMHSRLGAKARLNINIDDKTVGLIEACGQTTVPVTPGTRLVDVKHVNAGVPTLFNKPQFVFPSGRHVYFLVWFDRQGPHRFKEIPANEARSLMAQSRQ